MKKLLVLSGQSKRNKAWGEACVDFFASDFDEVHFIEYDHWKKQESEINFSAEINKIKDVVNDGDWYIFAKSIGSIVALMTVSEQIIKPVKCIFFGMSLSVVKDTVFAKDWSLLSTFKVPTLAFHNTEDPIADCAFAEEKIKEFATTISLKELAGNNHDYLDFADYKPTIDEFLHN